MLLEQSHRVVAKPGQQRVEFAFVGVVGANLEDAVFLLGLRKIQTRNRAPEKRSRQQNKTMSFF